MMNCGLWHAFGTHLGKNAVPPRTAQAAMPHSSPRLRSGQALDPTVLARRGENVYTDPSSASRMRGYEGQARDCSMWLVRCRRFLISRRAAPCTSMGQPA